VVALALLGVLAPAGAAAAPRSVHFDGRDVRVPAGWPVYRLAEQPRMCVRLDRRAVYLGTPSTEQSCSATAIGRRRAILVEPRSAARRSPLAGASRRAATASAAVFTGLGFDACAAPSSRAMAAWGSSPYRAIGVYIGGTNRACSQPNLTSAWVAEQTAAGWHLIPTYVGLQAPGSSCASCAKLSAGRAAAQGAESAIDAVAQASAVAIGPGSPIYFDMESYERSSTATSAMLTFLEAWTEKLHQLGYLSGFYSSSGSGIADLARQVGSGYVLPDDLWIANWNGQQSTADAVVPSTAWSPHKRIHQYRGGHNEAYGGVAINIDNNYVDADTVGTAALGPDDPVGSLDLAKAAAPGQVRVRGWAFDPNAPTSPLSIRLLVGGREGDAGTETYELGPASRGRRDVVSAYPQAGSRHGFDVTVPTTKSGRQRVCAYALDLEPGEDKLLGCKSATIPVAISLSHLKANARMVRVRVTCEWPSSTECPLQVVLRTSFRVSVAHRGPGPRTRRVSRVLGRSAFRLAGGAAQTYRVPLSAGGRALLRSRGTLKTQVLVAIPGGKRVKVIGIHG
jgi:hypothetical protein